MALATTEADRIDGDAPEPSVLIVEDDEALAEELCLALGDYGLRAQAAHTWDMALEAVRGLLPDAIVLDQRLGRVDTVPRIAELRAMTQAPILVLTGNRAETDRIVALEIGADDFVLKPISGRELVARIRAHLRRVQPARPAEAPPARLPNGQGGQNGQHGAGWRLLVTERELRRADGSAVPLTGAEFDLLVMLAELPGRPVDRDTLSQRVLRRNWRPDDRALDNLVLQLRKKVGPGGDRMIIAVRGQGYAFTAFPKE